MITSHGLLRNKQHITIIYQSKSRGLKLKFGSSLIKFVIQFPQKRDSDSYFPIFETNKMYTSKPKKMVLLLKKSQEQTN